MAKRTKKQFKKASLKLEALESRQLLAGVTGGGTEVGSDIHHPNGNVYDQVLMNGSSVAVSADAGQVTRVSFLDMQGDIVQAEFSGAGTLTVSLDGATTKVQPDKYLQTGVEYVKGNATFTITGSDASTNFSVFSVGKDNAVNKALFDDTHTGGDNTATVQRITIVADPSNPNGSIFGGIRAANATFTGDSGVVGITAANVQIQNVVRIGDIDATGSATPALVFGANSQFGSVEVAGGDLAQTNGKSINNSGSYGYQISAIDGTNSAGTAQPKQTISTPFTDQSPYPVPQALSLTTAIDNIVGSATDDVINGSHTSSSLVVSALDKIDGGAGNDLLNISDSNGGTAQLSGLSVKNVETFMYTSTGKLGSTNSVDTSGWTGLTSSTLTLQDVAAVASTYKADKGTAVTINSTSTGTPGAWTVTGGSTVDLTNAGATGTTGATINGVNGTTSASVTQTTAAGALGAVTVKDYAIGSGDKDKTGTLATVSVNGAVNVTVNSNALATLSLTKVTGDLTLTDELAGHATSGSGTTLALNLNETTLANLNQTTATVKEIDFTTSGKKSSVGTTAWGTAGEITTIKVAGDQALNLNNISGLGKLATLTGTGTAGVTATVDGTKVTVSAGDGADVITMGDLKKAVTLGGGNDWIQVALNTTDHKTLNGGTIDGGDGTDTLSISGQDAVTASTGSGLAGQISGFEKLEITGGNFGTVDLHNLDDINQVILAGDFGGAYTLDKLASGASLTVKVSQAGNGTITVPVSAVQTESLSVTLTSDTANVDAKTLITGNINTVNLNAVDTNDTKAAMDTVNFTQAKVVNITGNLVQLTTDTGTAGTVDASGMTAGKLVLTTTAGDGSTIKGTTKDSNDITATGAGKVTITTGNSNDTIAIKAGTTVTAGDGANSITAAGAAATGNTITTGKGNDTITVGATSGTTTISAGDGNDSITVAGAAVSNITLGGGTDTVVLSSKAGSAGYFTSIIGAGDGDKLDVSAVDTGAATFNSTGVTLGQGATFSDYVAAATTGDGSGNAIVSWFNFGSDTYVVVDNTLGAYSASGDVVVRLTGTLNLDTTANGGLNTGIAAGVITI